MASSTLFRSQGWIRAEAIANDARKRAFDRLGNRVSRWVAQVERSGQLNGVRYEIQTGESDEEALSRLLENPIFDLAINGVGCREGRIALLETTVEEVIQRSECPVLTMSTQLNGSTDGRIKSILYATDFSPDSLEASRYAVSLAQEFEARLTILHVVEGLEPAALADERARIAKLYQLWLGKLVPDEARLWCELELAVEFGRPAERILQVAWENHVDLIVLGARGPRSIDFTGAECPQGDVPCVVPRPHDFGSTGRPQARAFLASGGCGFGEPNAGNITGGELKR